jgi:hypothetical protein
MGLDTPFGPALLNMAIRINLLAEEQAAEEMRRKNPVKLGIWIGSFLVACVLLWILKLQLDIGMSENKRKDIEQHWKDETAKYASVTNNMAKTAEMDRKLAALDRLETNRFFWAPVLNALQQTMIDNIQVTRLTGVQKYTKEEAKITGAGASKKTMPGSVTESITLVINAKDFNPNAQNYSKFKEALCNYDFFVKNLGRRDGFTLDTVSPPSVDPLDPNKQSVVFQVVAHFPDVRRNE